MGNKSDSRPRLLRMAAYSLAFLSLIFFLGTVWARRAEVSAYPIEQPIKFNHLLHTQEWELECDVCHQYVKEQEFAGNPQREICSTCHEDALGDSEEEALLIEYVRANKTIPWRRLYDLPSHVYYSHRRHVVVAGIDCVECHGEIGLSTSPPSRPLKRLTMEFCIECHAKRAATVDCNACHR